MIGGSDVIFEARNEQAAMDMAMRVLALAWSSAVFEDADTGQTFKSYRDVDLNGREEILVYRDAAAQEKWREEGPVDGTMVHLIGRRGELTLGLDDVPDQQITSIVDVIRKSLRTDLFAVGATREKLPVKDAA
jgi:hypothetical protein